MLRILAYHRVFDMGTEDDFAYDPELVSASPDEFSWQMEFLARRMQPMALTAVVDAMGRGEPLPPRAVVVTFDDGHADNYTHAFPVLRRCGIPATVFLSTGYIGGDRTFWFDQVAHLLYRSSRGEIVLPGLGLTLPLGDVPARRRAAHTLLGALKRVPDARRLEALRELEQAAGVSIPPRDPLSRPLTWDEVREMQAGGIEFGSHTVSHPILSRLDDRALADELGESRRELEARLGRPAEVIAYPVGGAAAFDDRTLAEARACGYRMGLTYVAGVDAWPPADPFLLRRLPVERYTTRARFEAMLAFPGVFA